MSRAILIRTHAVAALSGAAVLAVEVLGARILAPHLGTAYAVWVNIIGVILAALAVGYWFGGRMADRHPGALPWVLVLASLAVLAIVPARTIIPAFGALGLGAGSLLASLLLFAPSSVLLGMVSPCLVAAVARDGFGVGSASGSIGAAGTVGSIVGTFITGFWLIPNIPLGRILAGVAGLLAILSWLEAPRAAAQSHIVRALAAAALIGACLGILRAPRTPASARIIYEQESRYYNIRIHEDGFGIRTLLLDGSTQSARYRDRLGEPHAYADLSQHIIAKLFPAGPAHTLSIGGGGYVIPRYVLRTWPDAEATVLEIDPAVSAVAEKFFFDAGDATPRLHTVNADGRVFLNRAAPAAYDLVYTDAYSGAFAIPPQLATREAFARMREVLLPGGVALFNIASAVEGPLGLPFRALWVTLTKEFPGAVAYTTGPDRPTSSQNIIVVAPRDGTVAPEALEALAAMKLTRMPDLSDALVLTDDFAPTDRLVEPLIAEVYPRLRAFQ